MRDTAMARWPVFFGILVLPACAEPVAPAAHVCDSPHAHDPLIAEPGEGFVTVSAALSTISCKVSTDTGYVSGKPFQIKVVTVDGKKAEWQTANAYYVMAQAAAKAGVNLKVVSGFRTMAEQQYLYKCYVNCNCNSCNLAAKPGYSNHQSGHALDLNSSAPGVYAWLTKNGGKFGFKKTVPSENWHWEWWGGGPGGGPCQCVLGCDDKNACTDDKCQSDKCVHANNKVACNDGNACTVGDLCAAGKCAAGPKKDCNDKNACTDDSCKDGKCLHVNNKAVCDDGSGCTLGDKCSSGKCVAGPAKVCDDKNPCTTDACAKGACAQTPNTAACSDGDACTEGDACAAGKCAPGKAKACDDANACTADACAKGACQHTAASGACDDGDGCSSGEQCAGSQCAGGVAKACDDGNPCTADACKAGQCYNLSAPGPCDDGNACTQSDQCESATCHGLPMPCSDGLPCTVDACVAGACVHSGGQAVQAVCLEGVPALVGPCGGEAVVQAPCLPELVCQSGQCVAPPADAGGSGDADAHDAHDAHDAQAAAGDATETLAGDVAPVTDLPGVQDQGGDGTANPKTDAKGKGIGFGAEVIADLTAQTAPEPTPPSGCTAARRGTGAGVLWLGLFGVVWLWRRRRPTGLVQTAESSLNAAGSECSVAVPLAGCGRQPPEQAGRRPAPGSCGGR